MQISLFCSWPLLNESCGGSSRLRSLHFTIFHHLILFGFILSHWKSYVNYIESWWAFAFKTFNISSCLKSFESEEVFPFNFPRKAFREAFPVAFCFEHDYRTTDGKMLNRAKDLFHPTNFCCFSLIFSLSRDCDEIIQLSITNATNFFSITYYGNSIYFLNNHQILKADLSSGELKEFCPPHFYKPISLTAYDHEKLQQHIGKWQRWWNPKVH